MKSESEKQDGGAVASKDGLGEYEPGRTIHSEITGCDDLWAGMETDRGTWRDSERAVLEAFCAEVNKRAEANMLKTGKLEGSHYAAMKQVLALYSPNEKLSV